jgi:hypothetical protein
MVISPCITGIVNGVWKVKKEGSFKNPFGTEGIGRWIAAAG